MNKPMTLVVAIAVAAAWPFAATSQSKKDEAKSEQAASKGGVSREDQRRFMDIAEANMAEIATGKLAQSKGQSQEVKDFAKHMIEDHTRMLKEGEQLGAKKGLTPPKELKKEHQQASAKLEKLSGEEFDRAYAKQMVDDHQKALKLVQDTAKNAKDAELKAMAEKATPEIQKHLEMAKGLAAAGAGSSKAGKSSKAEHAKGEHAKQAK